MKLPPQRIAAFLKAPDKEIRAALVYGPDAGLVRERAQLLAAAICADLNDAFRVSELDSGTLAGDPARLAAGPGAHEQADVELTADDRRGTQHRLRAR